MPSVVEVKITGLDRIEEALERIPLRVAKKIMRNALVAAGRIWNQEIASRVRRGPHHWDKASGNAVGATEFAVLANNVQMRTHLNSELEGSVSVGFNRRFFWAKFLEFGTGPRIRKKAGLTRAQKRQLSGGNRMPAYPFMRQAASSRSQAVLDRFTEGVKQALNEEYH